MTPEGPPPRDAYVAVDVVDDFLPYQLVLCYCEKNDTIWFGDWIVLVVETVVADGVEPASHWIWGFEIAERSGRDVGGSFGSP